jgi:hypothetical protein
MEPIDYAESGLTVQAAMLDHYRRFPDEKIRPDFIFLNGAKVKTADRFPVPRDGKVEIELISAKGEVEQGLDIKVSGWIQLLDRRVKILRTWNDANLEPIVSYPFHSKDSLLWVWNVYKVKQPGGILAEEKWTGNAGICVQAVSERERVYHCSPGTAESPDFESLIFRLRVS